MKTHYSAIIVTCLALASCAGRPKHDLAKCEALFANDQRQEAAECFMPAANDGDPKAQYYIGELYLNAQGSEDKDVYAEKMFRKSAEQNYPDGIMALGDLYALGIAVPKDESKALKWYQKAADLGDEKGMLRVAECYFEGIGTKPDESQGLKWWKLAADKGSENAVIFLSSFYYMKKNADNYAETRKWTEKAAEASDRVSFFRLGIMNYSGEGAAADKVEAYKWFLLFNKFGQPDPMGRPEALAKELSSNEKIEAQRRADDWLKIHTLKIAAD